MHAEIVPTSLLFVNQQPSLFENALKYYIQKEDVCGFQDFFESSTAAGKANSLHGSWLKQGSNPFVRKNLRHNSTGDAFSFAKINLSNDIISSRKPSNSRNRILTSPIEVDHPQIASKRITNYSQCSNSRDQMSPTKNTYSHYQTRQVSRRMSSSLREMSTEKSALISRDELVDGNGDQKSPYDPLWIERLLKKNFNVRIQCENEETHLKKGIKPKWKAFRISTPNSRPFLVPNQERPETEGSGEYSKLSPSPLGGDEQLHFEMGNNDYDFSKFSSKQFKTELQTFTEQHSPGFQSPLSYVGSIKQTLTENS